MSIEIKQMTLTDLEKIQNILLTDFDDFWSYDILKKELTSSTSYYFVAYLEDEIVGFGGIKIMVDEADIMNLVTKKNYRNQGIASCLLQNLITFTKTLNLKFINLEVMEENISAIHIYEKLGFKKIGLRKNYYKNKNGIFMQKKI